MSSSKILETEEEDEEMLRRAALNTIPRFKDKMSGSQSSDRLEQNIRTNNNINNKLNYYNNSHRNGSKRSNLIILTKTDNELSNSQTDTQSNRFTKITDKTSEVSEKRKRVLPGRFSRLEREDSDEDTDDDYSDHYNSDDNRMTIESAFTDTSPQYSVIYDISQNLSTDHSINDKIEINEKNDNLIDFNNCEKSDKTKDSLNASINDKNKCLANTLTNDSSNNCKNSDSERKETIKLNSNNVSKSDALERRKQKFGQTSNEERVNTNTKCLNTRSQRPSVKNRLSNNSVNKQKNSNERNNRKSVNTSHRHHSIDESDDSHPSRKKLRSLVVMK